MMICCRRVPSGRRPVRLHHNDDDDDDDDDDDNNNKNNDMNNNDNDNDNDDNNDMLQACAGRTRASSPTPWRISSTAGLTWSGAGGYSKLI